MKEKFNGLRVLNPELILEKVKQKNSILDILLENNDVKIGIDMQATSLNMQLYKRFQQYLSRLCSDQLVIGNDYGKIKPSTMIIFVKDYNEETPPLIVERTMLDREHKISLPFPLQKLIIVQLPYINEIAKEKKVLNEFEALIYLLYNNTLEGINYTEEGVIEMMKDKKAMFVKEEPALYSVAQQREDMTIDYDLMMRDYEKDYAALQDKYEDMTKDYESKLNQEIKDNALL